MNALPFSGHWLLLTAAAFVAGILNAVAGGGSLLLFPAMLGTGMLPIHANATNTVALWPGQLTSIAAYRDGVRRHWRLAIPAALAGLAGGIAGATMLLHTPQATFLHLVPWLLLTAALLFAASGPVTRRLQRRSQAHSHAHHGPAALLLLFILIAILCFYVGYFGAGGGFLIITVFSLFGIDDMNEINALKVVTTTVANGSAFALFVIHRQVEWRYCLLAMVACAIGGYSAARFARRIPQPALRALVVLIGLVMTAWFFYKNR